MSFALHNHLNCGSCPIRERAICAKCSSDELKTLDKVKTYRTIPAGQVAAYRGQELSYFSSVVSGVATLTKTLEDGRVQMVGLLLPSDFIGRPGRLHAEYDVTAITDLTLCCFDRQPFEKIVETTPTISLRMLEMTLDELDAARDWMVLLGRKTAREKIASFLEMLVRRTTANVAAAHKVNIWLSREEIANYLGLTFETVSRQLSQLKKDRIIEFVDRRYFNVMDMSALHDATGDDADGSVLY